MKMQRRDSTWECECERRRAAPFALFFLLGATLAAQEPPRFQSSVELTSVDVVVVDGDGRPVLGLTPDEFDIRIDGRQRRAVTAEWVPLTTGEGGVTAAPPPEGYSSNENATGGRLIVIAVDQPNIRFGAAAGIQATVANFIDRLQPADRIAVVGFGPVPLSTPFSADRDRAKLLVARMAGQRQDTIGSSQYNIAISEALRIEDGDRFAIDAVIQRECGVHGGSSFQVQDPDAEICAMQVMNDARQLAFDGRREGQQTVDGLRQLLVGLRRIDAPKTLLMITEGFVADTRQSEILELGNLAAAARTSLYALHLDSRTFGVAESLASTARLEDRNVRDEGLNLLASSMRGSLFRIVSGADGVFGRIESELSGYYLIGVESASLDTDGEAHPIRIDVARSGVTVRSRRHLMSSAENPGPRTPREAVLAGLRAPLMISALPLRVTTFSLQGPEESKLQILMHADVGAGYSSPTLVSLAYVILDDAGRAVDSQVTTARLGPVMDGVPSPLLFTGGASLDPGEYTLKLAVAEGDLVGTVEHRIEASLVDGWAVRLSELMAGGPVDPDPPLRPTVGHTVSFGLVHGYLEAYGPMASSLNVEYEIADDPTGPALLDADAPAQVAGDERTIFTQVLPVRQLPPGTYYLRAVISSDEGPPKTMVRSFEVASPAVLMTSAESPSSFAVPEQLFLPVNDTLMVRPFTVEEAMRAETVGEFRERVSPEAVSVFDDGVAALAAGDHTEAETRFKAVLQSDGDATAPLAYLAATFAASGHDAEATGAWHTALIDGEDMPQIYLWLGDALIRTHELEQARTILEEAVGKWPADMRFAKPLALVYATFGRGREAVRTLARHLETYGDDRDALLQGVEWIYHLHASRAVARTRAEDIALARRYAEAYEQAEGLETALVRRWLDALEGGAR